MSQKLTFDEWMKVVDYTVAERTGLSAFDLPDCPYHDWYDDGVRPASAAARAIKNAKE